MVTAGGAVFPGFGGKLASARGAGEAPAGTDGLEFEAGGGAIGTLSGTAPAGGIFFWIGFKVLVP